MASSLKPTWHRISEGESRPVVLFVHHVGGSQATLKRHVQMVNDLGFDAVTFDLSFHGLEPQWSLHFDFYFQWAKEIEAVGRNIQRPKILYTFSRPSTCALRYIVKNLNQKRTDIIGLISDSGPFIVPLSDFKNMLTKIMAIEADWKRRATFLPMMVLWDRVAQRDIKSDIRTLARIEPNFPILTIRGLSDTLVPPHQIDRVYQNVPLKALQIFDIPECAHLNGLRDFASLYQPAVARYLKPFREIS